MLFDKFNIKNIEDGIFAVNNFISEDECKKIVETLKSAKYTVRKDNILVYELNEESLSQSNFIENKIKENISDPLLIKEGGFNCILQGNSMSKHNDLDGFDHRNFSKKYGVVLYLNNFDHYVKKELKIEYYGRYVDDFYLFDKNINNLKKL